MEAQLTARQQEISATPRRTEAMIARPELQAALDRIPHPQPATRSEPASDVEINYEAVTWAERAMIGVGIVAVVVAVGVLVLTVIGAVTVCGWLVT